MDPNEMTASLLGGIGEMQKRSLVFTIKFSLKGHEISVQGGHPEYVIQGAEGMKKAAEQGLSKVKN